MPVMERDGARIHHQVSGDGFPVLLIAPGGLRSAISAWQRSPWHPVERLSDSYRVIAMDQRNAGESTAPITAGDGWHTYTADQLALLDHLGVDQFHVVGMCIGGPYIMGLCKAAPGRVRSAVMFQPIGHDGNRQLFDDLFDGWRGDIAGDHPEADDAAWSSFREAMFGGEFLFNTTREEAAAVQTPILLMMGDDPYHPQSISRELADRLPNVTFVERWKEPELLDQTHAAVVEFLAEHTP